MTEIEAWFAGRFIKVWMVDRPDRWLVSIDGRVVASLCAGGPVADVFAVMRSIISET